MLTPATQTSAAQTSAAQTSAAQTSAAQPSIALQSLSPDLFSAAALLLPQRPASGLIPTRLIILNYWLFHHEVFHFAQGRLFLTGRNGSGKSTAMTAAVTMLLDGDTSPARLDAFGSRQRSLAYYLLGNDQAGFEFQTRRSYLALEFIDPEGQYQTIGLGLQLTRGGGDLKKWGFWLPGQVNLPGKAALLERDVPLSEAQLRERLTQHGGEVVSGQTAHADLVRRRIFGPSVSPDEYRDTLNLILRLRGSKLGGEVRLSEVQRMMRESLRPVSAEDRAALNAGIDKIDTHMEVIAGLERQHEAAHAITEAHFQATLARLQRAAADEAAAALARQGSTERLERLNADLSATETAVATSGTARDAAQTEWQARSGEKSILELVMSGPLEAQERLEASLNAEQRQATSVGETLKSQRAELNRALSQQARDQETLKLKTTNLEQVQADLQRRAWWAGSDSLPVRQAQVTLAAGALTRYGQTTTLLTAQQARLLATQERQNRTRAARGQERERLEAELLSSAAVLRDVAANLTAGGETLDDELLQTYQENLSSTLNASESFTIIEKAVSAFESVAREHEAQARDLHASARQRLQNVARQLAELRSQVEAEPPVPAGREGTLALLTANGVTATPLYALVKPREGADPAALAGTEAALSAAGLLTALYVSPASRANALDLLRAHGHSDVILGSVQTSPVQTSPVHARPLSALLEPEEHAPDGAATLLDTLSQDPDSVGTRVGPDGRWRNGLLEGQAQPAQATGARYLGREARLRERQVRLELLERELAEFEEAERRARDARDVARQDGAQLAAQTSSLRAPTQVQAARQTASARHDQARTRNEEAVESETRERRSLDDVQTEHRAHGQALAAAFTPLGVTGAADSAVLQALRDDLAQASREHGQSVALTETTAGLQSALVQLSETAARLQGSVTSLERQQAGHREQAAALTAELRKLTAQRSTPDMAAQQARLKTLTAQVTAAEKVIARETTELARLHERLSGLNTARPDHETALAQAARLHEQRQAELQALLAGHPRLTGADPETLAALLGTRETPDAPDAELLIRQERDTFETHRAALETPFSYAPLFERGPTFLTSSVRTGPDALLEHLTQSLQENMALLTEEESQVFSGMLIRNLVEEIHRKVKEAADWTEQIRETLRRLNFHGESFDLKRTARAQTGLPGEGLAALIDGSMNPNLKPAAWWEKVNAELRSLISHLRAQSGSDLPFAQAFEQALDHRQWTEFRFYARAGSGENVREREITDRTFMTRSGGERSAVLYTYLFAAIAARFDTLGPGVPRLIAIDEAFAGMDLENINSLYEVMTDLDLSWIATSERPVHLSPALPLASAYEFFRTSGENGDSVSRLAYLWDGQVQRRNAEADL